MSTGTEACPIRLLLVEPDPARARTLTDLLAAACPLGGTAVHASRLSEACDALREPGWEVVLVNPSLPDSSGLDTIRLIRAEAGDAAMIVLTDAEGEATARRAVSDGAQDYLVGEEAGGPLLARAVRNAVARRDAAAAHRHGEARFRSLFEQSLDGVLLTTPDGAVLAANPAACRMFGYTEEEFRALGRGAVADPDDPRLAEAIEERRRTGRFQGELTFVRRDGGRIPVELSSHVFRDGSGELRTSMFVRDVTERRRAEQALAESERRHRGLVQGLHDGVFVCDAENRIVETTEPLRDLLGFDAEEMHRLGVGDIVDAGDLANAPLRRRELQRSGSMLTERLLRRRDGTTVPVEVASVLLGDGRVECVVRDITERRRAEREKTLLAAAGEVFASSLDYRQMLRGVAELTVPDHADWCVIDVISDEGTLEVSEVVAADPHRQDLLRDLLDRYPHSASPERHPVGSVLRTGEPVLLPEISDVLLPDIAADPHHLALLRELDPKSSMIVPLVAHGRILGAMALTVSRSRCCFDARDLELASELGRRAALAVEKARLHASVQQAVQTRDQVLSYVAHDLRSPLGAISLLAELLLQDTMSEEQRRRFLEAIVEATERIDRLIQDLLDVGRIEAGRLQLEAQPLDVRPLVRESLVLLEPVAREAGLQVSLEIPESLPRVLADRSRLLRVFSNVVGNAIKFTPAGGTVTLRARPTGAEVLFSVTDTGPGIPPEHLPHLFDRFWQARRTQSAGAGLGLAIARGIVEAHGGRIWAMSEPGQGSTFFFTLPYAAGAEPAADADGAAPEDPESAHLPSGAVRVLLVDDHPVVRRGLVELLAGTQRFTVVGEASSGEEALRLVHDLSPDIVVLDLGLPGMDGIEATRRILAANEHARVLVFTAEPEEACLLKVLEAGGNGFVRKSTAHRDLIPALDTVAAGHVFLPPSGSDLLLRGFREAVRHGSPDAFSALTEQERGVVLLTAEGFTSREIGKRLYLSPKTVDSYRSQLMRKLGLRHRADLVQLALRAGLLRPNGRGS